MKTKKLLNALYAITISVGATVSAPVATWGTGNEDCEVIDVNGVCYDDYGSALAAVVNNSWDTYNITLHQDIVDNATNTKWFLGNYTDLDLNGHTLTTGRSHCVYAGDLHITGNGKMILTGDYAFNLFGYTEASDELFTNLVVDNGVTLQSNYNQGTYIIRAANQKYQNNINVDFNGRLEKGENSASVVGFGVNGMLNSDTVNINIGNTASINVDFGAYIAGKANVNYSGIMNTTMGGIEIRNGNLNITGGAINVPSSTEYIVTPNGNGATTAGAAIAVAQHTTKMPISVNISGGIFTAPVPFSEANPQDNPAEDIAKVSSLITGGAFNSTTDKTVISSDLSNFISGGVYNIAPAENYVAEGYTAYQTGINYMVLPTAETSAEDDVNPGDPATASSNTEILSGIASEAVSGILANYDSLDNIEYSFDNGLKVKIADAEALRSAIAAGKTISAKLVKSNSDVTESLPAEEVARLYAAKAEGSTVLGIYDFSIVLVADTDDVLATVTELSDAVNFSFDVSGVEAVADGYERKFQVIREHNGIAEEIDSNYDATNALVKTGTNRFSSFLVAYTDSEIEGVFSAGLPNTGAAANFATVEASSSATSSSTIVAIFAAISLAGLVSLNTLRNKIRRKIYRH
ncbi:hypothetical protein IKG16_01635 [Candidatus Saccharibacteria bacterium]|nr:hypothetical protein [Candidatus Saccharibacteria bacterium]